MKSEGASTLRWKTWRKDQNKLCDDRTHGTCEICGGYAGDKHHAFGRGHIIAEPLASHHACMIALCRRCHSYLHDHPKWKEAIRIEDETIRRLQAIFAIPFEQGEYTNKGMVRGIAKWLEKSGDWLALEESAIGRYKTTP